MFRSGFVTIIGLPNVGKSTLINALVGEKVSIVTHKIQTTRHRILGIVNREHAQVIFFDTPGIQHSNKLMDKKVTATAYHSVAEADIVLHVVPPHAKGLDAALDICSRVRKEGKPYWVLINKIDLVPKEKLLFVMQELHKQLSPDEIIPISALKKDGLDHLMEMITKTLPEGPAYYPQELYTEHDERFLSAEVVREKAFELLHEELPYALATQCEAFEEEAKIKKISIVIFIEKASQKGMVIGKGGAKLKQIGKLARTDLEKMLGQKVYLKLYVRVAENWSKNEKMLRDLGL